MCVAADRTATLAGWCRRKARGARTGYNGHRSRGDTPISDAFTDVRIWDGTGYLDANTVVVEGSRIAAVGGRDIAAGSQTRSLAGLTVVPGLIDAHVHMTLDPDVRAPSDQLMDASDEAYAKMVERAAAMVAAGITTARDLGGGHWLELRLRDAIDAGEVPGPRLLCAGQPVTSIRGHCHFWNGEAADLEAAVAVIERQAEKGVDLIKIMATGGNLTHGSDPSRAQFDCETTAAMVRAANERGYDVAAHCHGTQGIDHAARARVNTIEHCSWLGSDGRRTGYDDAITAIVAANGVWVSPTINAGWQRFIDANAEMIPVVRENFSRMRAAGVKLIASTDAGIPNVRHHELSKALAVFAAVADLSPAETLRAATADCAEAIGLGAETGRIQAGLSADLLFLDGDPLNDLKVLQHPVGVLARGVAALELN